MRRKITTLIIDDEEHARSNVQLLLSNFPELTIVGLCEDGLSAVKAIKAQRPNLIFLDIQMPEIDGFAVLKQLSSDELPYVIFTTAYSEYAISAFEVNAVDYLLKPIDDQRFMVAVQRAIAQIEQNEQWAISNQLIELQQFLEKDREVVYLRKLAIRIHSKIRFVPVEEVIWIEADNQYVKIHTLQGAFMMRQSLSTLENELNPAHFYRSHRSAIININAVTEIEPYFKGDYTITLRTGIKVKLSRTRTDGLRRLLNW